MAKKTEQIRQLENSVRVNGTLAELRVFEGNTKNDVPYISLEGSIKYGNSGVEVERFKTFCSSQKADGSPSKAYQTLTAWVEKAVPMTSANSANEATKMCLTGSVSDNDFYNSEGELVESIQIDGRFFNAYEEENKEYTSQSSYTIEGYVKSIADEVRNDEPTGRKRISIVTADFRQREIIIKNIIVPAELVDDFENTIEKGDCTKFFLGKYLHKGERKPSSGGIGRQRTTSGRDYVELIFEGCGLPYEEENPNYISNTVRKEWSNNRVQKLETLKEEHENAESSPKKTPRTGVGKAKTKIEPNEIDEEDIPF